MARTSDRSGQRSEGINVKRVCRYVSRWAAFVFYFLSASGVRQTSFTAAAAMFAAYLLDTVFYFWVPPFHFSFFRLVGLALLLTDVRARYLMQQWRNDARRQEDLDYAPLRSRESWHDKLPDQMPMWVWPWGKAVFYARAFLLIPLETYSLAQLIRPSF